MHSITSLHCIALHYTALLYIALHCNTFNCITLHCITSHTHVYIIDELGHTQTRMPQWMAGYHYTASDGALGVPRTDRGRPWFDLGLSPLGLEALHPKSPVPSGVTLQQTNRTMEEQHFK